MSLFADERYRWRETYFVLFKAANRPAVEALTGALHELGHGYQVTEIQQGDTGEFESLTVVSPSDYAAMDISFVDGEEVAEQIAELKQNFKRGKLSKHRQAQLEALLTCDARFDVFHFEQVAHDDAFDENEDEFLDPGMLLLVLKQLAKLCHGVAIDPQSGGLM